MHSTGLYMHSSGLYMHSSGLYIHIVPVYTSRILNCSIRPYYLHRIEYNTYSIIIVVVLKSFSYFI